MKIDCFKSLRQEIGNKRGKHGCPTIVVFQRSCLRDCDEAFRVIVQGREIKVHGNRGGQRIASLRPSNPHTNSAGWISWRREVLAGDLWANGIPINWICGM